MPILMYVDIYLVLQIFLVILVKCQNNFTLRAFSRKIVALWLCEVSYMQNDLSSTVKNDKLLFPIYIFCLIGPLAALDYQMFFFTFDPF